MREWINNHPISGASVALILLVIGLVIAVSAVTPSATRVADELFYLDPETGEWFVGPKQPDPPVSPAGHGAVPVMMYGCGGCGDERNLMIGHAHYYDEQAVQRGDVEEYEAFYVSADGRNWVPQSSSEGRQIRRRPECPDGSRAQQCTPGGD